MMCFFQIVTLQDCTVDWLIRALFEAMETTLSLLTVSHRRVVHFLPPGFVPGVTQQEISQFLTSAVLSPLVTIAGRVWSNRESLVRPPKWKVNCPKLFDWNLCGSGFQYWPKNKSHGWRMSRIFPVVLESIPRVDGLSKILFHLRQ